MSSAKTPGAVIDSPIDMTRPPESADEAWNRLNEGNLRFAEWVAEHSGEADFEARTGLIDPANISKQTPFGIVVGCSDARFPLRAALGQRANSLFEIRVAGNVLADECLGSIDYALHNLPSVKTLVVLGHTHCGAVTATVNAYLDPASVNASGLSVGLRAIVQRLLCPVVHASAAWRLLAESVQDAHPSPEQLIETAIYLHAATAALDLRAQVEQCGRSDVNVLHGVFDLGDYQIRSLHVDAAPSDALRAGLSAAPYDAGALAEVALATAASVARCELMS